MIIIIIIYTDFKYNERNHDNSNIKAHLNIEGIKAWKHAYITTLLHSCAGFRENQATLNPLQE